MSRFAVLMRNIETGTSAQVGASTRTYAEGVAARARRRDEIRAGVVGRIDGEST